MTEERIIEVLKVRFPEAEIEAQDVQKANVVERGIVIKCNSGVSPVFYLSGFEGKTEDQICSIVSKHMSNIPSFNADEFHSFESVKSKIQMKLINTEWNSEFLKDKPSIQFADLSIVYYFSVDVGDATGFVTITNAVADMWGVDECDLYEIAKENASPVVAGLSDFVSVPIPDEQTMTIVSNRTKTYGAGMLPIVLNDLKNRFGKFYVLPSSVHEVIVLPEKMAEKSDLDMMVKQVNDAEVEMKDRLADHAYYFDGEKLCA